MQEVRMFRFILLAVLCASNTALASDEKFVMKVDEDLKVMKYDRGLFYNSWKPFKVDGFITGESETMSFEEYAQRFYIGYSSKSYRLRYVQTIRSSPNKCHLYPQNIKSGQRLGFYEGDGDKRRYIVLDDLEDYLVFNCEKE